MSYQTPLVLSLIDYEQAFDYVDRRALYVDRRALFSEFRAIR